MKQRKGEKVSIIVPVYMVEKYIESCINSLIEQTYYNLEIILVDDGSPDDCPKICDEWAKKDTRIKVLHQKNSGVSAARNSAIEQITGEYILFVDSDDWIEKNMIETLVDEFESSSEIDAVFCGFVEVDEQGNTLRIIEPRNESVVERNEGVGAIFGEYGTVLWNKMFRTELLNSSSLFDVELKIGEDELWMVNVLKKAKKISLKSKPLYYYRRRLEGASNDYSLSSKRLSEITAQQRTLKSIADYNSEKLNKLVECRLYYCGYKIMRLAYYQKKYDVFNEIDREIKNGRRIWYKTHNHYLGNCRRKVVETMMRMHVPQNIVKIFDKNDMIEWKK